MTTIRRQQLGDGGFVDIPCTTDTKWLCGGDGGGDGGDGGVSITLGECSVDHLLMRCTMILQQDFWSVYSCGGLLLRIPNTISKSKDSIVVSVYNQ